MPPTEEKNSSSWGVFVSAFVVIAAFLILPRIFASKHPMDGTLAPQWSLPITANINPVDSQAKELSLAQLAGKTVVLDFWATWCGPCKAEAPILETFARNHPNDLVVVGIQTDDEPGGGPGWARSLKLTYPLVYDSLRVGRAYKVSGLPTLVVVNKTGKISAVRVGVTDESELEELYKKAQ